MQWRPVGFSVATLTLLFTMSISAQVQIEKAAWNGWPNCYRISNGEVELVVTSDIGPRIMRYGFVGGQNFFWEEEGTQGKSGEKAWVPRGGHRIWIGPEDATYTYPPDNSPVQVVVKDGVLVATEPVEPGTHIEKQIEVRLDAKGTGVTVIHRLTNRGIMPLEFAAWALSMMSPGGMGITGFPPRGKHPEVLAPTNPLVMFAFSDLSDPRWKFTQKYLTLRYDAQRGPTKIGHFNRKTWGAYVKGGEMFVKRYDADPSKTYPDFGASYETFTNTQFLEIETLGPVEKVAPGKTIEHVEHWTLHKNAKLDSISDEAIDGLVLPVLGDWLKK